jgi:amidase
MFEGKAKGVDIWSGTGFGFAMTWPWNLLNRYPVVDVPLGLVEERMPSGIQVIGQTYADLDTFQFASNWSRLQPALFAEGRVPEFV